MEPSDDQRFRAAQRLAYDCVEHVASRLTAGTTERAACAQMRAWLAERGVTEFLHTPFAWFGDRAAFAGFRTPLAFFPTRRRLAAGMAYILDVAPVVDGCTGDVGYTGWLGENAIASRLMRDLEQHRALILEQVTQRSLGDVYDAVIGLARKQGYEIRHRKYPFGVLGHRVERIPEGGRFRATTIAGFGARSLAALARVARSGALPLWNGSIAAHRPLPHGRWAVEPHLAFRGVGAKFEEILVVDAAGARWLDDDLPHVRRWRRSAEAAARVMA